MMASDSFSSSSDEDSPQLNDQNEVEHLFYKPKQLRKERSQDDGQTSSSVQIFGNGLEQENHTSSSEMNGPSPRHAPSEDYSQQPLKNTNREQENRNFLRNQRAASNIADPITNSCNQPSTSSHLLTENQSFFNQSHSSSDQSNASNDENEHGQLSVDYEGVASQSNSVVSEREAVAMEQNPLPAEILPQDDVDDHQDNIVISMREAHPRADFQNVHEERFGPHAFNDSFEERLCLVSNRVIDFSRPHTYERCVSCGRCVLAEYAHEHEHCNACVVCRRVLTTAPLHHTDVCARCRRQVCQRCSNLPHYC